MGAAISTWQPPENDSMQLTKQDVIDLIGAELFDEEKFLEYAPNGEWVTVAEFKMALNEYAVQYMEANSGQDFEDVGEVQDDSPIQDDAPTQFDKDGDMDKHVDDETFDSSYEDGTADETSYLDESGTFKSGNDTAGGATKETTVAGGETRTSAGDDFSESVLPALTITKMTPEELDELRLETAALHDLLLSGLEEAGGVFPPSRRNEVLRFRECLASTYEQTKEPYLREPQEIAQAFIADYYHVLDYNLTSTRSVARYYETDSVFNFVGIPDVIGRRPISRAIVKKFAQLRVRHRVKAIAIDESPPNMCTYLLTCKSSIALNDDKPRNVLEIFYIKERDDELKRAKYGPFYIFRQILVAQDARPLYSWAEMKMRPGCRDNWDDALERPDWLLAQQHEKGGTVGELTADDEEGSGDGSYSGSDRDDTEASESDDEDEDGDGSVSVSKKNRVAGDGEGLQTVAEESYKDGGSVGSKQSSVMSATILRRRAPDVQESYDAADDMSAMSGSAW